ncbi:putative motor protein [Aulographum hederae CBS 113979]|uniref:Putative motor protein n=1 Tax=Aulographum hederae CBS 113979 TaxID=1176131 RepID=A0A6G1GX06_9PEZI|nr:putative motor protein [Aulographum hederae CBS 113979]
MAAGSRVARDPLHKGKGGEKKEIWSAMLENVSSGKRLPEKSILVLGGTPDSQKDFLEALSTDSKLRPDRTQPRKPPVANQFALGYTYQDVLDADQEDTLARLSLYLLTEPSPAFTPLLQPLLTPRTLPSTLIVILLDWTQPWLWLRQLRDWIRVLRSLISSLPNECKDVLEENIKAWQHSRNNSNLNLATTEGSDVLEGPMPLGTGEFDEPLGLPLCVVAQNASHIENLERSSGWKEPEFDTITQYVRTVLLKHGGGLIYTMPGSQTGSLQTLIHSSLGIQSLLEKRSLKHDVVNKERILVPLGWDSWGKIRVNGEGFDIEGVSSAWSVEIQTPQPTFTQVDEEAMEGTLPTEECPESIVSIYESTIRDPSFDSILARGINPHNPHTIEVETQDHQEFLAKQMETLDQLRTDDEKEKAASAKKSAFAGITAMESTPAGKVVEDHIGPVQFNVGGIQMDAGDVVKKLKDREATRGSESDNPRPGSPEQPVDTEKLQDFFAGLLKPRVGSAANSPRGK